MNRALITACVACLGCLGAIGEPSAHEPDPDRDDPVADPDTWSDPWFDGCDSSDTVGESPLRRLTTVEYRNSVRDLLGVDMDASDILGPDESIGPFRANVQVEPSDLVVRGFMEAAETLAQSADLDALVSCEGAACAEDFIRDFVARAWRRPLLESEVAALLELFALGESFDEGIALVIEASLASPHFLYIVEGSGDASEVEMLDPHQVATRLSYFLWRTTPDQELLDVAAAGGLDSPEAIEEQALRMLEDTERVSAMLEQFYFEWLGLFGTDSVPHIDELTKDTEVHASWNAALAADMRREVTDFVTQLHEPDGDGSLRTLLTGRHSFITPRLAELYGVEHPTGSGVARVELPPERSGVFTLPGVLAVYGKQVQSAPVQRGVLVRERFLCLPITPPPPGVMADDPPYDPNVSRREQFEEHGTSVCGASCHMNIDPLGFTFEHYDGIGRFREMDGPDLVDATGSIPGADVDRAVDGIGDLAEALVESETVRTCVTRQWVRFALAREVDDERDRCAMSRLRDRLRETDGDLRALLVEVAKSDLLTRRGAH